MRLIDADKLCMHLADLQLSNTPDERDSEDVQKEMKSNYEFIGFLIKLIEKQPTAYDVDKVVDRLDDEGKLDDDITCILERMVHDEQTGKKKTRCKREDKNLCPE